MLYEKAVRPLLFKFDPEFIHDATTTAGVFAGSNPVTRSILSGVYNYQHPMLSQKLHGITFRNPVGLSAGFDKDCRLMKVLPAVGFGFEEVGSITADAYVGNPGPRLVRLPKDQSLIVNYGLKNRGADIVRRKFLRKDGSRKHFAFPIGISVAKTNKEHKTRRAKVDDWVRGIKLMKDCGDYLTINVSCPNTYDPTNFGDPALFEQLMNSIKRAKLRFSKPVFIKLSADITPEQFDAIIAICDRHTFVKGFVLTNLVKDRSKLRLKSPKYLYAGHKGGLSGKVVYPYMRELLQHAYKTCGSRYTLIACGGIFTAEDAYACIKDGASLVQLITGMIYGGPATIKRINKG
ncbi:TPA: quinone-dependent dihydroorotate dehydrogenase, partial [Candidatus Woesearchaeota archaeon]|nr:quinone-dependent dihydroorotate dehydrogenase [Candidatus Woesearchaeota archaeon]